jgi:hypothetical protein
MTSSDEREPHEQGGYSYFSARDHSHVGAQIGYADTININQNSYNVQSGDPPAKKYEVACKFLDRGDPRRAQKLIDEAVGAGFPSDTDTDAGISRNHVAYHWILAVLSGRSFSDLRDTDRESVEGAKGMADRHRNDRWLRAFNVIMGLLTCIDRQEQTGGPDPEFGNVLGQFMGLPDAALRQDIQRHLEMILEGSIQNQLEAKTAEEVVRQRMSNDRRERVPLFFEADPEGPRAKLPERPVFSRSARVTAAFGVIAGAAGLLLSLRLIAGQSVLAVALFAVLLAGGGYATVGFGLTRFAITGRRSDKEREYGGHHLETRYSAVWHMPSPPSPAPGPPLGDTPGGKEGADREKSWVRTAKAKRRAFNRHIPDFVKSQFAEQAPKRPAPARRRFRADTARIEAKLIDEILELYSDPPTEPFAVDWLIKWRVKEIARKWREGSLHDYRDRLRVPPATAIGFAGGVTGLIVATIIALIEMLTAQVGVGLISVTLVALGLWLLARSRADVYLVRLRRLPDDQADAEGRLRAEQQEHDRWLTELERRPTDEQMARWLDYDKSYLKKQAMNQFGIATRDVVAHAILAEAGEGAKRARVSFGPPRYSKYIFTVFVLTTAGVREVTVDLDFATGDPVDQRRRSFRYDAIASAQVAEIGIRFDDGSRPAILPQNDQAQSAEARSFIFGQVFRLSFIDGRYIDLAIENLCLASSGRAQDDASGITGALRVLETVAAEGREWIAKERERHRQTTSGFQKIFGTGNMLEHGQDGTRADTNGGHGNGDGTAGPASSLRPWPTPPPPAADGEPNGNGERQTGDQHSAGPDSQATEDPPR